MTDGALYNEIEPFAADWLENLIAAGKIAPGVVDRRSIVDLDPDYVRRFRQVHLFAGIGIWSAALRGARWPDDRRILTGSCPCQPFSSAGQGAGFDDERHLWPAMYQLAAQCDFDVILGEQVASKDGLEWVDLVRADLEGAGYAFAAFDLCAAGFGAPHIRQRLNWVGVANAYGDGRRERRGIGGRGARDARSFSDNGEFSGVAQGDASGTRLPEQRRLVGASRAASGAPTREAAERTNTPDARPAIGLALPHDAQRRADLAGRDERDGRDAGRPQTAGHAGTGGGPGGLADAVRCGAEPAAGNGDGAQGTSHGDDGGSSRPGAPVGERLAPRGLADANGENSGGRGILGPGKGSSAGAGAACERPSGLCEADGRILSRLADANDTERQHRDARSGLERAGPGQRGGQLATDSGGASGGPGPVNGGWASADWLYCRDGRWRPVEPGTFPLAHALPKSMGTMGAGLSGLVNMAGLDKRSLAAAKRFRTGTLRGFGNAVVYEQTEAFCAAVMETIDYG